MAAKLPEFAPSFSVADLLRNAEQIKGLRLQNQINQQNLAESEELKKRQSQINELSGQALAGNQGALNNLAQLDPKKAQEYLSFFQSQSKETQNQIAQTNKTLSGLISYVRTSPNQAVAFEKALDYAQQILPKTPAVQEQIQSLRGKPETLDMLESQLKQEEKIIKTVEGSRDGKLNTFGIGNKGTVTPLDITPTEKKPLVSILNTAESAENKKKGEKVGEALGDDQAELIDTLKNSPGKIAQINVLESLLENAQTGPGAETINKIKKIGTDLLNINIEELGFTDNTAPTDAAIAIINRMALQLRSPAGGEGLPGAVSNYDLVFLQNALPGLIKTKGGSKIVAEVMRRMEQRKLDNANFLLDHIKRNGRRYLEPEDYRASYKHFKNKDMFGPNFVKSFAQPKPMASNERDAAQKRLKAIDEEIQRLQEGQP